MAEFFKAAKRVTIYKYIYFFLFETLSNIIQIICDGKAFTHS